MSLGELIELRDDGNGGVYSTNKGRTTNVVPLYSPDGVGLTSANGTLPLKYYLGLVAGRCGISTALAGSNKQLMSRSIHVSMEDVTSLQVVFANWYCNTASGEVLPGASSSVTASIEYPMGTITRATFSGVFTGTVADGANLVSDAIAVTIPRGAKFAVRMWHSNATGIMYNNAWGLNTVSAAAPVSGEWLDFGVTTADLTNSTTNSNNKQTALSFRPAAIIGMTRRKTYAIIGDSRVGSGVTYDAAPSGYGYVGEISRSVGRSFATMALGRPSEKASDAAGTSATRRIALAAYCSDIICNYGINDCKASVAAATTITNLATIAGKFGAKPFYICTVSPESGSTDSWATTVNQTANVTSDPLRVALNGLMRAGTFPPAISGYFEVADQVESSRDSGLWKVTGSANGYTADGLHGNAAGNNLIELSAAFSSLCT